MRKLFLFVLLFLRVFAFAQNTNYYVDGVVGNDNNPGTEAQPWKTVTQTNKFNFEPGDQLLFAGGQTFGLLQLQNNDAGLAVKSYNGTATLGGINAYNVGDITIDGLICKGPGMTGNSLNGIKFYMDSTAFGDLNNILIQNVSVTNFGANGILIGAWATNNGFNDVKVLNSNLYLNGVDGFASYGYNDQTNHTGLYIDNVKSYQNYGRIDITTTNTGSGFTVGGFDGGLVENSEAYECGKNNRNPGGGPQGFWCYNSKNIVFQYCVSHDNKAGRLFDGGGFDIDGGSQNCTVQYCYSYNNDGAGYAFFEHGSTTQFTNNTIRYNISQNDARANTHGSIMMWAQDTFNRVKNSAIHNNTIYVTPSARAAKSYPVGVYNKWSNFKNISFYNNIIYTTDTIKVLSGSTTDITFGYNNYYNPSMTVSFSKGGTRVNPLFATPGGGKNGYVLKAGSPMINAGKTHAVSKDIIGTAVPSNGGYDKGAYESKITPPVAKAGADQTITLPTNSVTLSDGGSTDNDGTVETYAWTKTEGPASFTIDAPHAASTAVSNLVQGTYTFRLTVTDNDGATGFDDVQVIVNPVPPPSGTKFVKVNVYGGTNAYANAEWSNWNVGTAVASNKSISALKYSDGTGSSGVAALLSYTQTVYDNGSTYGGTMCPPEVLRYCSYTTAARTLTLSGLNPSKTYGLELYGSRAKTGYSTIFTIGDRSVTIVTDNNRGTPAIFTNLSPDGAGKIVVTLESGATVNATPFNYLNGFVLSESANPPPPPGTKFVKVNVYGGTNAYANAEWSNWNVGTAKASNKSISALQYSDGTASGVGALLSQTDALYDNGSTYGGTMCPPPVLRYCSNTIAARTLTLSGLNVSKTYNLELYASRAKTGYSTIFTIGDKSVTVVTDNNRGTPAIFTNLSPDGAGKIVVTLESGATVNATPFNYLNGFVLTETVNTVSAMSPALTSATKEPAGSQLRVQVYPNPSGSQFTLQISGAENEAVQVRVVDVMGRIVEETGRISSGTTHTIGRQYKPGVYYAQVMQGYRKATVKLVKQSPH